MAVEAMKTKKSGIVPDSEKIPDDITKKFGKDLTDSLQMNNKDVYDDLTYLFGKVTEYLPLAGGTMTGEIKGLIIENRTDDTGCTQSGRVWFRTDV